MSNQAEQGLSDQAEQKVLFQQPQPAGAAECGKLSFACCCSS